MKIQQHHPLPFFVRPHTGEWLRRITFGMNVSFSKDSSKLSAIEHGLKERSARTCPAGSVQRIAAASKNTPAARPASARDSRHAFRVVVVGELFASPNPPRCNDPNRAIDDVRVAVRVAGVIDVSGDVAAHGRIAGPPIVDVEDPDAL